MVPDAFIHPPDAGRLVRVRRVRGGLALILSVDVAALARRLLGEPPPAPVEPREPEAGQ
jgi:hypothetical protein